MPNQRKDFVETHAGDTADLPPQKYVAWQPSLAEVPPPTAKQWLVTAAIIAGVGFFLGLGWMLVKALVGGGRGR